MMYYPSGWQIIKVMIYLLTPFVIQSEAKNLENILVDLFLYVTEIFRYAQQHVFLPSVV